MTTRMRSPNYPGTPLQQAVEVVDKIFRSERTHSVEREVAAKAAGYGGLSGRSAKVLADLSQYGLLERTGKSGVRVSRRAVEILHPDDEPSRVQALQDAAFEPELFQRIKTRFPDGLPSEAALRSYFLKEGFTDGAIQPAIRGYMETCRYIEETIVSVSPGQGTVEAQNLVAEQRDIETTSMNAPRSGFHTPSPPASAQPPSPGHLAQPAVGQEAMTFDWPNKRILISRVISSRTEANDVIAFINAMVQLLPADAQVPSATGLENDVERADEEGKADNAVQ